MVGMRKQLARMQKLFHHKGFRLVHWYDPVNRKTSVEIQVGLYNMKREFTDDQLVDGYEMKKEVNRLISALELLLGVEENNLS